MQVVRVSNTLGVDDIKLIAQDENERDFLKRLADAGSLTCLTTAVGMNIVFRPVTVMEEDYVSSMVSDSNSIGRYNFEMRQNEDKVFDLNFTSNGEALPLSVYDEIILQVKKHKHGPAIISLSIGEGLTLDSEAENKMNVSFTPEQTEKLSLPQYYYDVLFKQGTTHKYYLEGTIIIIPSVSR